MVIVDNGDLSSGTLIMAKHARGANYDKNIQQLPFAGFAVLKYGRLIIHWRLTQNHIH